jgi:hypothetical protein
MVTGLPGPTIEADAGAIETLNQATVTEFELTTFSVGWLATGGVTYAANVWSPALAVYPTEHWLACMQAPTSVPVVWSKISIAERVPVIVTLAVAVRTALWPGFNAVRFVSRRTRG